MSQNHTHGIEGTQHSSPADAAILNKFNDVRFFYEGIGNMTRMVHSATHNLDELHKSQSTAAIEIDKQPSTNFLGYVRELTADSASKVLDKLEHASPVIDRLQDESTKYAEEISEYLQDHCSTLEASELKVLLLRVQSHLKANHRLVQELAETHGEILTLQSYQDLTSQAITKAENLLVDVESTMVSLLKSFSDIEGFESVVAESAHDQVTVVAGEEAQQETKNSTDNAQLAQDDVDSLLSQLGF